MLTRNIFISRILALHQEIRKKINEVGIIRTIKLSEHKLINEIGKFISFNKNNKHPFDLMYGTDTDGIIKPDYLDIPIEKTVHAVRYQTAIVDVFLGILNSLLISHEEFLFIDLGSGKGRALLLASKFPYKEIIGIELSENLHEIAIKNIQIYRDELQKCYKIKSICCDVYSYEMPHDENIVFYLYNPFDAHVMRSVLQKIENIIQRYHKKIFIAYLKPVHRDVFDQSAYLQIVRETERYIIYKNSILIS